MTCPEKDLCDPKVKPQEVDICQLEPCTAWVTGGWSKVRELWEKQLPTRAVNAHGYSMPVCEYCSLNKEVCSAFSTSVSTAGKESVCLFTNISEYFFHVTVF